MKAPLFSLCSFIFLIWILPIQTAMAISFSWVGNYSTEWENPQNWNPSTGYPDSADFVTISSGTYNLQIHQNRKVSNLTLSSKTIDLNGYSLTVYGTATFTSGTVTDGTLYLRGNLAAFNGTTFGCPVDADCGYIRFSGSTFNSTVTATDNGVATGTGAGGCTFNGDVHIIHNGTGTYFTLANSAGDIFNANLRVTNNSDHEVYLSTSGVSQYKGNVILESTSSGGVSIGNNGGTSTLDSAKTISIGTAGFSADVLTLKNFTQVGTTAQVLTLTGTAIVNIISSTFNGSLTVTSPGFLLKNSTFNGESSFTRNGTSNHQSDGGNTYNGNVTFSNNGSGGRLRLATTIADTYSSNATFNSTGQDVQVAYLGENLFKGDITINSNKVVFNTSTGKVTFAGSNNQSLNGSYNFPFKKLAINKTSGTVTANTTLSVDDSLIFVKGNLITSSTSVLTMKHGSKAIGASSSSLVEGPVKKTGNTAFIYPLGKNSSYRPLEISAPSTTTSEFTGEYVEDSVMVNSVARDTTLAYLNRAKYWKLNRNSGSSQVYVTLSWDSLNALTDTFITVASWNGSQWKDLGKGLISGNKASGTIKASSYSSTYNEFTLAFLGLTSIANAPSCKDVQSESELRFCLNHATVVNVTADIFINAFGQTDPALTIFPIWIQYGVTLQGVDGSNSQNWWDPNCHLIFTNHSATYVPNVAGSIEPLYLFGMQPGCTLQNLRIRGPGCNFQDYNQGMNLSGGVIIGNSVGGIAQIKNCEISCFTQANVWKRDAATDLNIENSYIHKVKGHAQTGIGYGIWTQGNQFAQTPQEFNCINNIFDDCKTSIDGQGDLMNWTIDGCSLTQFFQSEDINNHNDNRFRIWDEDDNGVITQDYHYCFLNGNHTCLTDDSFYGIYSTFAGISCNTLSTIPNTTPPTYTEGWMKMSDFANGIPMYDVAGANTVVTNSIFHKKRTLSTGENGNGNINVPFPISGINNFYGTLQITNNTFTTKRYSPSELKLKNNLGGYAKVADNNIDACVWEGSSQIVKDGNSFEYKPGVPLSSGTSPIPCEVEVELSVSGTALNLSHSLSPNTTTKYIPISNVNDLIKINPDITNATVNTSKYYIIRPNPSDNASVSSAPEVLSGNNNYYDLQDYTNNATQSEVQYSQPGLYGIDVLAFDVHDYSTGTTPEYHFNASAWKHVPVIVKNDNEEQVLYFNIKDSYRSETPIDVFKEVRINDIPIWSESIAEGGQGWELVRINLDDATIKQSLHLDGTPNVLSFGIFMGSNILSSELEGLFVWVDDIYVKKYDSPTGDNLIRDGSVELIQPSELCSGVSETCYWFQNADKTFNGCSGSTDGSLSSMERKSGGQAITLQVDRIDCTYYYIDVHGELVVSVGTVFDFTDLLSCDDYTNVLNFNTVSLPCASTCTLTGNWLLDDEIIVGNNETLVIDHCQLVCTPNGKITVNSGGTLNMNQGSTGKSHLFACEDMWQGIENNGGSIYMWTNGRNKIQDAETAIAMDGGIFEIRYTDFDQNYQGLYLTENNFTFNTASKSIYGCTFNCTGDLFSKGPIIGKIPDHHIFVENVDDIFTVEIGDPAVNARNVFSNAFQGIVSINSNVKIKYNDFNSIYNKFGLFSGTYGGSAIKILKTGGPAVDVEIGDLTDYKENRFSKVNMGILVQTTHCMGCNLTISGNDFVNTDYKLLDSGSGYSNTAISIQNPYVDLRGPLYASIKVFDNNILDHRIGIHAISVPNIEMAGYDSNDDPVPNEITYNLDNGTDLITHHTGIWLQNSSNTLVKENIITNNSPITINPELMRGIVADNSTDLTICGNSITNLGYAMQFEGNCENSELKNNIMTTYEIGINYVLGKFSDQGATGASWANKWIHLDQNKLKVDGSLFPSNAFTWYYEGSASDVNNEFRTVPSNPLVVDGDDNETNSSIDCKTELVASDDLDRDALYGPVIADTITYILFPDEARYLARQALFKRLSEYPELLSISSSLDSAFQAFHDSVQTESIGLLDSVSQSIGLSDLTAAATANAAVDDVNSIETNTKFINNLIINKLALDSALSSSDTTTLETIFAQHWMEGGLSVYTAAPLLFKEYYTNMGESRFSEVTVNAPPLQQPEVIPQLGIYPNPTNCIINFNRILPANAIVKVYDTSGREMIVVKNPAHLDVSNLEDGYYILKIFENKELVFHKNIVIIK